MRTKIRAKISAIFIVPFCIAMAFIIIAFVMLFRLPNNSKHLQSDERYTYGIFQLIEENSGTIRNRAKFTDIVEKELNNSNSGLCITDLDGNVLYSYKVDEEAFLNYYKGLSKEAIGRYKNKYIVSHVLTQYDKAYGKAFIVKEDENIKIIAWQNYVMIGVYAIGFLLFFLLMLIYLKQFSNQYIKTISELKRATEYMEKSNFNFTINSYSNDELGEFCWYFNEAIKKINESMELKQLYEEESKFMISSISHDLRTPLTCIKSYVEGLQYHIANTPEKFDKYLNIIKEKTIRMDRLLDDLSEYSKFQMKMYSIEKEQVNGLELYEKLRYEFESEDESKSIHFEKCGDIEKCILHIDVERIKEVIDNMIANAIHYSEEKPLITVKFASDENVVRLSVKDNGIGIAKEDQEQIFDQFYRSEEARTTNSGGMGLGLAIVKKIVEAHNANIYVQSEMGEGSEFIIEFKYIQ